MVESKLSKRIDGKFVCCIENGGAETCPKKPEKLRLIKSLDRVNEFAEFCKQKGFDIEDPMNISLHEGQHQFKMVVTLTDTFEVDGEIKVQ